jgi:Tfp pilus assembly protein PilO
VNRNSSVRRDWVVDGSGIGVCALATLVLIVWGLHPMFRRQCNVRDREETLSQKQAMIADRSAELERLTDQVEQAREALKRRPFRLVSACDVNVRIAEMATLAMSAGLKLDEIEPGASRPDSRYERIPIHLAGTGNYPACVAMLHRLRRNFPDTTVIALDLSGDPADSRVPTEFQMELMWHAAPTLQTAQY